MLQPFHLVILTIFSTFMFLLIFDVGFFILSALKVLYFFMISQYFTEISRHNGIFMFFKLFCALYAQTK